MTTKNLIPRGSGEGGIGITDVTWGYGYYDTGNFNKGLFVSGHNITQVIAETVTQGGLGGEWERNVLDIYYNGGNVGIGTANPGVKLDVRGSLNLRSGFNLTWDSDGLIAANSTNMQFHVAGGELMRITSAGNVGIGTTDPDGKLEVKGGFSYLEGLSLKPASGIVSEINSGSNSYDLSIKNGAGESLRIKADGNVGIGTVIPYSRLDVNGVIEAGDESATSGSVALRIKYIGSSGDYINNFGSMYSSAESLVGYGVKSSSTAVDKFLSTVDNSNFQRGALIVGGKLEYLCADSQLTTVGDEVVLTSVFKIDNAGNVGIGTPDPGGYLPGTVGKFKLDIASSESLFMGCDDANPNVRTANTNKSFRVGGASYQYSETSSIVAINSLFCSSDNTANRLGIGFGTSSMQAPSEIVFATQAYNTFNQTSNTSGTLTNRRLRIDNNGILVYGLSVSSDVQTNSNGYLITSSDKRLKNDLGDCEYGLPEVLQVQPKKYTWKDGPEDAAATIGFFAQDVHSIMPEAAPREAVKNENGEDDYKWGFHSQTIIAALVNATKEQQQLIEDLRSEIEALKNK